MKSYLALAMSLLCWGNVQAENAHLTPQDFAFGAHFNAASGSLVQVRLAEHVLQHVQQRDFADLRVFNAAGNSLAFALQMPSATQHQQQRALAFFPLDPDKPLAVAELQVQLQQAGELQTVQLASKPMPAGELKPQQYIVHNQREQESLCGLQLDWQPVSSNQVWQLQLESSSNLEDWRPLGKAMPVSHLQHGTQELRLDELEFPCTQAPYLRLSWQQSSTALQLSQLVGLYTQHDARQFTWQDLAADAIRQQQGEQGTELHFTNPGVMALEQIQLLPNRVGQVLQGKVYSRNPQVKSTAWQYRGDLHQYRLQQAAQELQSPADTLSAARDRHWKIVLTSPFNGDLPQLRLGWQAEQLLVLTQGSAPFTVAYGNPQVQQVGYQSLAQTVAVLSAEQAQAEAVSLGKAFPLGEIDLQAQAVPWQQLILWAVLLLGTAMMGWMAYRLLKQMER